MLSLGIIIECMCTHCRVRRVKRPESARHAPRSFWTHCMPYRYPSREAHTTAASSSFGCRRSWRLDSRLELQLLWGTNCCSSCRTTASTVLWAPLYKTSALARVPAAMKKRSSVCSCQVAPPQAPRPRPSACPSKRRRRRCA